MRMLELFSGSGNMSKAFAAKGFDTTTVDIEEKFNPDICKDIMEIALSDLPKDVDVIWASPPCQSFSVASIYRHWEDGQAKSDGSIQGRAILYKTLWIMQKLKPKYWFIENPRGMMRKEQLLIWLTNVSATRNTVTYCQYGDKVMKPTDIWTNNLIWKSRSMCKNGASCHESAKRGQDRGTQNQNRDPARRAVIPTQLCDEIAGSCK